MQILVSVTITILRIVRQAREAIAAVALLEDKMQRPDLLHSSKVSKSHKILTTTCLYFVAYNSSKLEDMFPVRDSQEFK